MRLKAQQTWLWLWMRWVSKFNLIGNSAGTILAQDVMRDYPQRLRCVILSSPAPLGVGIFQHMIDNGVRTLQRVFKRFSEDKDFNAKYPTLKTDFLVS